MRFPARFDGSESPWRRHRLSVRLAAAGGAAVAILAVTFAAWALFSAVAPAQANAVSAAAVSRIAVTPATATVQAGTAQAYVVTAYDSSGAVVATVTSAASLSLSPDGTCTTGACTATVAGPHTVTAQYWGLSTTANLTVTSGAGAVLVFTQSPSSGSGGVPFATQPVVAVQDAYGNTVSGSTAPITLSITSGSPTSGGPGTLGCAANPASAVSGVASFSGCSITTAGTNYRLHAVSGSLTAADSAAFSVVGGALDHFSVSTPTTQNAGTSFTVTVTALDSGNNVAAGWTSTTRCVSLSGPTNSPNATAPVYPSAGACAAGQSSLSFGSSGQATATVTLYNAQTTSLTVTSASTPTGKTGASGSFLVVGAPLSSLTLSPVGAQTAGVPFTTTVSAVDAWGNPASGWMGTTTCVTFTGPASGPDGSAPLYPAQGGCNAGASALTFSTAGQASASMTLYAAQSTALTVTSATSPAGKSGTSATFNVAAASLSYFTVSTPAAQVAGAPFAVTVAAYDAWRNPAAGWTSSSQCVQLSDPAGSPNGTAPLYPAQGTCASGYSLLAFSNAGSTSVNVTLYAAQTTTLSAFDATATVSGTSGNFTVNAAAPAKLTVTSGSGQTTTVSTAFAKALAATVLDAYGNPVPQTSVTFTAPAGGASATFTASGCTSTPQPTTCVATTDGTGRATSGILTANATNGSYSVTAGTAGLTATFPETNAAGGVLHVSSLVTGSSSGTTTWSGQLTLTVTDSSGAPVQGVVVSGTWSPTAVTTAGCTTGAAGTCTIAPPAGSFPSTQVVETWTVSTVSATGYIYSAPANTESSLTLGRGCAAGVVCSYDLGSDAFDAATGSSSTTATLSGANGTAPANATVYVLVTRVGTKSGDSVAGMSGSALSSPALVSALTPNLTSGKKAWTNLWVYAANGTGAAAGTVTATFNNADNFDTLVQAVVVAGDNTAASAWLSGTMSCTTGCTTAASAVLPSPSASDGSLVLLAQAKDSTMAPVSSAGGITRMFWNRVGGAKGFNASTWSDTSAQATTGFTLGVSAPWGAIAVAVPQTR